MANLTWVSTGNGFWDEAGNWQNGGIPGPLTALDDVEIDVHEEITTTHRTGNTVIRNLTSAEDFVLSGGSLTATTVNVNGVFTINGGVLIDALIDLENGTLEFTSNGNNRLDGTTLQGDLVLADTSDRVRLLNGATFTGDAFLNGSSSILGISSDTTLDNKRIELNGSYTYFGVSGSAALTLGPNTSVLLNNTNARLSSDLFLSGTGSIINQGTIVADGTNGSDNRFILPDSFTNQGNVNAIHGAELFISALNWTILRTELGD